MTEAGAAPKGAKAAGRPDFSGYWRQIKTENMDAFLKVNSRALFRTLLLHVRDDSEIKQVTLFVKHPAPSLHLQLIS